MTNVLWPSRGVLTSPWWPVCFRFGYLMRVRIPSVGSRCVLNLVSSFILKFYVLLNHNDKPYIYFLDLLISQYKTVCVLWDTCVSIPLQFSVVPFYMILECFLFNKILEFNIITALSLILFDGYLLSIHQWYIPKFKWSLQALDKIVI